MFTSRSEYRLTLRPDNADFRLTQWGHDGWGCVADSNRLALLAQRKTALATYEAHLKASCQSPNEWMRTLPQVVISRDGRPRSAWELLKAGASFEALGFGHVSHASRDYLYAESLYDSYLDRQVREMEEVPSQCGCLPCDALTPFFDCCSSVETTERPFRTTLITPPWALCPPKRWKSSRRRDPPHWPPPRASLGSRHRRCTC